MAGLVPAIHVFLACDTGDEDARHKAGHDGAPPHRTEPLAAYSGLP